MTAGATGGNRSRRGTRQERLDGALVALVAGVALAFLSVPIVIVVPMSFSSATTLAFPPPGFSLRWYRSFFGTQAWLNAAGNSMIVALSSSVAALVLGSLAAYGLVRGTFRGKALLEGNFIAPLVVPPVVSAVALYIVFAQLGLLRTYTGLILSHTTLCVPYVVLLMSVAIRAFDVRVEQVAYSLGASWLAMFRRVLLPNLFPSVLAAWILAFIVSFDEIILTFFLFGYRDTVPKRMFVLLEQKIDPTITAIATMLIAVSVVTLVVVALLMRKAGLLARRSTEPG
jgi:ABC-type spermidine/putrescine transport system permease subunit II